MSLYRHFIIIILFQIAVRYKDYKLVWGSPTQLRRHPLKDMKKEIEFTSVLELYNLLTGAE